MSKHWTERMFIEKPSLFGKTLEKAIELARVYSLHELKDIAKKSGWTYQTC